MGVLSWLRFWLAVLGVAAGCGCGGGGTSGEVGLL